MTRVRVMTYNIYRGGGHRAALDEVVRLARPDVLLVNECPKTPLLWRPSCRRLAAAWGLRIAVGGRPAGSNLVAVAPDVGVESAGALVLRQPPLEPRRGIAWASLRPGGARLGVVSCHLSLDRTRREREVASVLQVADGLPGPVVVAGDLNEPPSGPSWRRLREAGFTDHGTEAWTTFPADAPTRRIDALLVRGEVAVLAHGDPGVGVSGHDLLAAASDHRPVLAVLDL